MRKCFALVVLLNFDHGFADFQNIKIMLRKKLAESDFDFSNFEDQHKFDYGANKTEDIAEDITEGVTEDETEDITEDTTPENSPAAGLGDVVDSPHLTVFLENALYAYGCWCYFGEFYFEGDERTKGYGTPIDGIDEFCRLLNDGYDCAVMDGDDENEPCLPWKVDYTYNDTCFTEFNDNNCAIRACQVEEKFVDRLYFYISSGEWYSIFNMHSNMFSPADECLQIESKKKTDEICENAIFVLFENL